MRSYRQQDPGAGALAIGCIVVAGLVAGLVALSSFILMLCWNAVVPTIFHGPSIDLGTAFAASVLLSIIGSYFRSSK